MNTLDNDEQTDVPKYDDRNMPFFILGCVRSGTTLLRDLLREHPRLECPEETHFFHWGDPFGTPRYASYYRSKAFQEHRALDWIDESEFETMLETCQSREHLAFVYGERFLQKINRNGARLFDKTPQNIYGIFLIHAVYPTARFIHIHRHPLNVVASLKTGKVMPAQTLRGAINYWMESMLLIDQFRRVHPQLLLEVPYESLVDDPDPVLARILAFVGEDADTLPTQAGKTRPEQHRYRDILSEQEIRIVMNKCEPFVSHYGYDKL
ncbi:MAG TPA: sulfotransferase [Pseudomonadales bacterium]|nr:sulfotransferase [Pseudomonadales bacterium]